MVFLLFLHAKQLLMTLRKAKNICKSNFGIDASKLYAYSICQSMQTGPYMRWYLNSETSRFTSQQNKTCSFESLVMSFFQGTGRDCKIEIFCTTGRQKMTIPVLMDFVPTATLYLMPWAASVAFVFVKKYFHLSLKNTFNVAVRKEGSPIWGEVTYRKKSSLLLKCWSVIGGYSTKQPITLYNLSLKVSSTNIPLKESSS